MPGARRQAVARAHLIGVIRCLHEQGLAPQWTADGHAINGRAWITGTHQVLLDPADPWPEGYRIGDTWPMPE